MRLHRVQAHEAAALLNTQWEQHNHRDAQALLDALGWSLFAQGDWAYAYESPNRHHVARVAPFDPGYHFFIQLCSRCEGNPYLPDIQLASQLEGGGHLTVMEHLQPAGPEATAAFEHLWTHPDQAEHQLQTLQREVEVIDHWGKQHYQRWWVGVDIGDRHILLTASGTPKIIDLFGLGTPMLEDLINDPVEFSSRIGPNQCRYLLAMPDLQDLSHPDAYLRRIEEALAIARATPAL